MLARILQFLKPPQFPEDDETARVANLLNTLLWLFLVTFIVLTVILIFTTPDISSVVSFIIVAAVNVIPLYLLKRRQVKAASWVTLIIFYGGTLSTAFLLSGLTLGNSASVIVLTTLAGLFLGRRVFNFFTGLSIILVSVLLYLQSTGQIVPQEATFANSLSLLANYFLLGVTINLTLRDLSRASNRMRQSNAELLTIQEGLEQTVADRTRDMELAASVGRSMSQIRDLNELLQNAVNTIQRRFGLYYVQIYLTDKNERTLTLQAGTGMVGRQLVQRGHTLSVGAGSINGLAAVEKRTVLVADTAASAAFKANTLLPYTRSEMAVPLVVADSVLGVLNLQSDEVGGLSRENLAAFETLAGQIAIAIENAYLFAEAAAAQAEAEEYLRFMTREGWEEYQDGIYRPEVIGMRYERGALQHFDSSSAPVSPTQNGLEVPIRIADELIGTIQLEADEDRAWSEEEREMVTAVAQQVAQQAENLRVLRQADRYRVDAELAARRLSGEAWRDYLHSKRDDIKGFAYKGSSVVPLGAEEADEAEEAVAFQQDLKINNEPIGELLVSGGNTNGAQELIDSVVTQLSSHIESLRLAEQTEVALAQTEILYQIGHSMNGAENVDDILQAALTPIFPTGIDEATLMFIEIDNDGKPRTLELLADWHLEGKPAFGVGTIFPVERFPFTSLFINKPDEPQLIGEAATDDRVDDFTRQVMAQAGIKAIAVVPLTMAGQWVGIITCSWPEPREFTAQEEAIFNALINLAAPAVQSQRLFYKTKVQADKEHLINLINERIQSTVTVQSALQTAVKELGQALKTNTQVKLVPPGAQNGNGAANN